ncbi:MAG: DEAD/DEAH box helicase [Propioniciclava sp.]
MRAPQWLLDDPRVAEHRTLPARPGTMAPWPAWVPEDVRESWRRLGVAALWSHQATAAEAAHAGHHVALATPTASGKSLAYLTPILSTAVTGEGGRTPAEGPGGLRLQHRPTALYLAPTKALAHDQLRLTRALELPGFRSTTLDGDSPTHERRYARDFADYILTNPDMLHRSILPNHARYPRLFRGLRYVVLDEAHRYRGLFGAHLAAVLRRLRRLAWHYGTDPVFLVSSATLGDPAAVAAALIGDHDVLPITEDASPRPARDVVVLRADGSLTDTAAQLLARLSEQGQTLAFTTSRLHAELVARSARDLSRQPETLASYRAGYLPEDRRSLETALADGRLRGVASTNALELGINISGMAAVVTAGFPGTLAAFWQQIGRAGRSGQQALAVLAARDDPLDAYLVDHPEVLFESPGEATTIPTENQFVLGPHLAAAAQEKPLTTDDERWFGPTTTALLSRLTDQGVLRRRGPAWFWTHAQRAVDSIDLRAMQGRALEIVDTESGRIIGQIDPSAVHRTVHPEAVYVHQGETWIVDELNEAEQWALVRRAEPNYFTQAQSVTTVRILTEEKQRAFGHGAIHVGAIELTGQVTGYLRRDPITGSVWDSHPLDFPEQTMLTRAVWWTLPTASLDQIAVTAADLPGAVHAAEHAAIGILPAFVPCDRWDLGGLSTTRHPDTGLATVFVHDGLPGGSGLADAAYNLAERWWAATLQRLLTCTCESGCPACVVSPKCGSGNNPLHKEGASLIVAALLDNPTRPTAPAVTLAHR